MLPSATDLMDDGGRRAQGRYLRQLLRSPVSEGEQSLQGLARGDQQGLYIHLLEPPQSEPTHPVPLFGLGEERLDPHLPLL
jgi:hypothetical protein